ncbi:MAG: LptF/LptG family permease [Endomicrobium sp.]|jgi:lipopolysaccharide export system permease protein|nr:LptF/LptG family permease [Endomicrobium sp.]
MTKIYKYIIKNFIKFFIFAVVIFLVIVSVSQTFKQLNLYINYETSFCLIILHLLSNIPEWFIQGFPIATLLAILISVGELTKNNEIIAMKAAGINILNIIIVFIIIGAIIGLSDCFIREFIITKTSSYSEILKKEKIKKEKISFKTDFYNQIIILPNNTRMIIKHLNTKNFTMKDIIIEKYNKNFTIKYLMVAKKAIFKNNLWIFEDCIMRNFKNSFFDKIYDKTHFKIYSDVRINKKPEDMVVRDIRYNSMNFYEFKKYINKINNLGQSTIKARIAFNIKFATIFAHIIITIVTIPFAMEFGNKLNKLLDFILALSITFIYWGVQAISKSLGENLIVSPFIAAWLPNSIFSIIGSYFLIKLKK